MMGGGYYGNGGWTAMMASPGYGWMVGRAWRNMTRRDWQRLQRQWLGADRTGNHDPGAWAILAIVLVRRIAAVPAALVLRRRPSQRPPTAASPS